MLTDQSRSMWLQFTIRFNMLHCITMENTNANANSTHTNTLLTFQINVYQQYQYIYELK